MLKWLELLQHCYNVATYRAPRGSFNTQHGRLNVALTLHAARTGVGYSLIEWKFF